MKWIFAIQQKLKAAMILSGIMALIVLFTFIERKNMADMNRSVSSIYNDRLIPATDFFYLSEHVYGKRFLTEQFLEAANNDISQFRNQLEHHNRSIAALIHKFEKTYLVDEESLYLDGLKNNLREYGHIEASILDMLRRGSHTEAAALFEKEGKATLQGTIKQLAELTRIQTSVGSELIKDSNGKVATSSMLSDLQIVLSIITGLIVIALIFASRISNVTSQQFHLN